jgi:hypothetical protein
MPWLYQKSEEGSDWGIAGMVTSVIALCVVIVIYVLSVISVSDIAEVNPLGVTTEDGTKYEVIVNHHSEVSFLPWSWSTHKTYVRWETTEDKVYWINPITGKSFLNSRWEDQFTDHLAETLSPEQIKAILAE